MTEKDITVASRITLHLNGDASTQAAEDRAAAYVESALNDLIRQLGAIGISAVIQEVETENVDEHAPLT